MKLAGPIIPSLAIGLVLSTTTLRGVAAVSANPYAPIVERNIFGLVPIPTNPPVEAGPPATPPPKITPNGTMTLFGKLQVLFKVAVPAKPGQPAKEDSYVMSEKERQNDIEVIKIDPDTGVITFNNHGTRQEIPLTVAPNMTAPAAGVPSVNSGGIPQPSSPMSSAVPGFPGRPVRGRGLSASTGASTAGQAPGIGNQAVANSKSDNSQTENLSPEAQVIMIEKNRLDTQEAVDKGLMPPLPPTAITPAEATGANGSPLVLPSEPSTKPK